MRGADQVTLGRLGDLDQAGGLRQADGHRLLDQDVLPGFKRRRCNRTVRPHRSRHEDELDVGGLDQVFNTRGETGDVQLVQDEGAFVFFHIAGRDDLDLAIEAQPVNGVHVSAGHHIPAAYDTDPYGLCAGQRGCSPSTGFTLPECPGSPAHPVLTKTHLPGTPNDPEPGPFSPAWPP